MKSPVSDPQNSQHEIHEKPGSSATVALFRPLLLAQTAQIERDVISGVVRERVQATCIIIW